MIPKWPDDEDGDVLRGLQDEGFDFSRPCLLDFNVDFDEWPPPADAIRLLSSEYPSTKVYEPDNAGDGYLQFQVYERLSYDLVIHVQKKVSELMARFNGSCNSWGVLHDPAPR
jgi:Regulator of ribonuclease activity B